MASRTFLLLLIPMFYSIPGFSQFFDGKTRTQTSLNHLTNEVQPGTILLLGENHGLAPHRDQHLEILNALRARGLSVSVGLEFINYTDQAAINSYRAGLLSEPEFLNTVKWGAIGFEYYRPQLNFPQITAGEYSLGLNLPRSISAKISKLGLTGLTAEELSLMPPDFQVGRASYRERFMAAAGAHCKVPENCFTAQSAWDDTIAWQATNFIQAHPEQVLVVIIGEFHVQYGGGTPDRIKARLPQAQVLTLSQVWAKGLSPEEIEQELQPSISEGPRADFIWVSQPE